MQPLHLTKNHLAVLLVLRIIERFRDGEKPRSEHGLAEELGISGSLTEEILSDLAAAGIISEVRSGRSGRFFQPGMDVKNITLHSVRLAIDHNVHDLVDINAADDAISVQTAMRVFETAKAESPANALVEDLVL